MAFRYCNFKGKAVFGWRSVVEFQSLNGLSLLQHVIAEVLTDDQKKGFQSLSGLSLLQHEKDISPTGRFREFQSLNGPSLLQPALPVTHISARLAGVFARMT